ARILLRGVSCAEPANSLTRVSPPGHCRIDPTLSDKRDCAVPRDAARRLSLSDRDRCLAWLSRARRSPPRPAPVHPYRHRLVILYPGAVRRAHLGVAEYFVDFFLQRALRYCAHHSASLHLFSALKKEQGRNTSNVVALGDGPVII